MAEKGENEVWLHGDINSMVVMELGGVVECWTPQGGETADGQKYARSVLQHKIRSIRKLYGTNVGKRTIVRYIRRKEDKHKAHSTLVGKEHKKYKCKKKNPPLSPGTYYRHATRFENAHG